MFGLMALIRTSQAKEIEQKDKLSDDDWKDTSKVYCDKAFLHDKSLKESLRMQKVRGFFCNALYNKLNSCRLRLLY